MKRFLIILLFLMASISVAESPEQYLREDVKDLAKALTDFSVSMVEQIATMRARLDILEAQVKENRQDIKHNTTFMDSMTGREGVRGSAWNYVFLFGVALASSIITMLFGWLVTSKRLNGKVNWNNKTK